MKQRIARAMRRWADRLDAERAPKGMCYSFTFEKHKGIVFNDKNRGCPVWYLSESDYDRAHNEALNPASRINWETMTVSAPPLQPDPNLIVRVRKP